MGAIISGIKTMTENRYVITRNITTVGVDYTTKTIPASSSEYFWYGAKMFDAGSGTNKALKCAADISTIKVYKDTAFLEEISVDGFDASLFSFENAHIGYSFYHRSMSTSTDYRVLPFCVLLDSYSQTFWIEFDITDSVLTWTVYYNDDMRSLLPLPTSDDGDVSTTIQINALFGLLKYANGYVLFSNEYAVKDMLANTLDSHYPVSRAITVPAITQTSYTVENVVQKKLVTGDSFSYVSADTQAQVRGYLYTHYFGTGQSNAPTDISEADYVPNSVKITYTRKEGYLNVE